MAPGPACKLCHGALRLAFRANGFPVERCTECGLLQVAEAPAPEQLAPIYTASYFKKTKYSDNKSAQREVARRRGILVRLGSPGTARTLLDFGCATGSFVAAVADDFEAYGTDISSASIAIAKEENPRLRERFAVAGDKLPADWPARFDIITAWDVIEHVADPMSTLRDLAAKLNPGGFLVCSTPDAGAVTARLAGKYWAFMTPPEHLTFFSRKTLTRAAVQAGLTAVGGFSAGRWTTIGFLFYKLGRILPNVITPKLVDRIASQRWSRMGIYVPTMDVQYQWYQRL